MRTLLPFVRRASALGVTLFALGCGRDRYDPRDADAGMDAGVDAFAADTGERDVDAAPLPDAVVLDAAHDAALDAAMGDMAARDIAGVLGSALCTAVRACPASVVQVPVWCEEVVEQVSRERVGALFLDSLRSGRTIAHPEFIAACREAIAADPCTFLAHATTLPPCAALFDGQVAEGMNCLATADCTGGFACVGAMGCTPGVCTAPGVEGAACTGDGDCSGGFRCSPTSASCTAYHPDGTACTSSEQCRPARVCLGATRICQRAVDAMVRNEGDACDLLAGPLCAPGLSCAINVCVAQAMEGGACSFALPDMCPDTQHCEGGRCVDYPATGPCVGGACAEGSYCRDGMCRPVVLVGALCDGATECVGTCTGGRCEPSALCGL